MLMMLSNNWSINKNYVLPDKKKDTVKFIWIFLVLLEGGGEEKHQLMWKSNVNNPAQE
jgi:hypothetical protein